MVSAGEAMDQDPGDHPTITVLNDDPDAGEVVARVLEAEGYPVRRVTDRAGAFSALVSDPPSVLVLDLAASANHGDTLALLERLRGSSEEAVRGMRILVVGQHSGSALFAWPSGADGFLCRPIPAEELVAAVADVVARPDQERAAYRKTAHRAAVDQHRAS